VSVVAAVRDAARARRNLVWLGLLSAVFVASVLWHPADDGGLVLCPFRAATGIPCPGCGLTRSFCAMGKGDVSRAFELHALGPVLFVVAGLLWLRSAAVLAGAGDFVTRVDQALVRWKALQIGGVVLIAVWVMRLVSLYRS
jgi:hypothetical protein